MDDGKVPQNSLPFRQGLTETIAIYVLAISMVAFAVIMFLAVSRISDIDELGLFNPVYMKIHYGRMTYPVYGFFQAMFVHPPVRYSEIAAFMRLGLTLPYAEGIMVTLPIIAIAFAIAWGRFDYISKLGLLFGSFAAIVWMTQVYDRTYSLRPDTQLALAWFLGLLLLEDGRLRSWDLRRIFLGSFQLLMLPASITTVSSHSWASFTTSRWVGGDFRNTVSTGWRPLQLVEHVSLEFPTCCGL